MIDALSVRVLSAGVTAIFCIVLGGCGRPDSGLVRVQGTVTCAGAPLPVGTVIFSPVEAGGQGEARGTIDEQGRFTMIHDLHPRDRGIPRGKYRVAVFASQTVGSDPETQRHEILVPAQYMNPQTSGLVVDVSDGQDRIDLDLKLSR